MTEDERIWADAQRIWADAERELLLAGEPPDYWGGVNWPAFVLAICTAADRDILVPPEVVPQVVIDAAMVEITSKRLTMVSITGYGSTVRVIVSNQTEDMLLYMGRQLCPGQVLTIDLIE